MKSREYTHPPRRGIALCRHLIAGILGLSMVLSMASCDMWDFLWTRDREERPPDQDLLIHGSESAGETDRLFEGAVEYTGKPHRGTDIYYIGNGEKRNRIIAIDAGHQLKGSSVKEPNGPGSDVFKDEVTWGATGVYTGITEYELNLQVALFLRDELIRRGYSVVMIRETNQVSVSNRERAEIANKYDADAYIRIHANGWSDGKMHGAMTLCHSPRNPYPNCQATYEDSFLLSHTVLDEFCRRTGIEKLSIREDDGLTGTNWSAVPTTLVEMGFMSNKDEDKLMATDFFRQEAAVGIANGIDRYFEEKAAGETDAETDGKEPSRQESGNTTAKGDGTAESVTESARKGLATSTGDAG